jgi:hypothetical protein
MVFQSVPEHLQEIALGAFYSPVNLVTLESPGLPDDGLRGASNGLLKCGVLSGLNANICEFKNHGRSPIVRTKRPKSEW